MLVIFLVLLVWNSAASAVNCSQNITTIDNDISCIPGTWGGNIIQECGNCTLDCQWMWISSYACLNCTGKTTLMNGMVRNITISSPTRIFNKWNWDQYHPVYLVNLASDTVQVSGNNSLSSLWSKIENLTCSAHVTVFGDNATLGHMNITDDNWVYATIFFIRGKTNLSFTVSTSSRNMPFFYVPQTPGTHMRVTSGHIEIVRRWTPDAIKPYLRTYPVTNIRYGNPILPSYVSDTLVTPWHATYTASLVLTTEKSVSYSASSASITFPIKPTLSTPTMSTIPSQTKSGSVSPNSTVSRTSPSVSSSNTISIWTISSFTNTDVSLSSEFSRSPSEMKTHSLVHGTFSPHDSVTRAHAVVAQVGSMSKSTSTTHTKSESETREISGSWSISSQSISGSHRISSRPISGSRRIGSRPISGSRSVSPWPISGSRNTNVANIVTPSSASGAFSLTTTLQQKETRTYLREIRVSAVTTFPGTQETRAVAAKVAGIVSSTSTSQASRINAILGAMTCDEGNRDEDPSYIDYPIQYPRTHAAVQISAACLVFALQAFAYFSYSKRRPNPIASWVSPLVLMYYLPTLARDAVKYSDSPTSNVSASLTVLALMSTTLMVIFRPSFPHATFGITSSTVAYEDTYRSYISNLRAEVPLVRIVAVLELWSGGIAAIADGSRSQFSSCTAIGYVMLSIAIAMLLYHILVRPYASKFEQVSATSKAAAQVVLALLVCLNTGNKVYEEYVNGIGTALVAYFPVEVVLIFVTERYFGEKVPEAAESETMTEKDSVEGICINMEERGFFMEPIVPEEPEDWNGGDSDDCSDDSGQMLMFQEKTMLQTIEVTINDDDDLL